jgi:Zn finger protein HypA/HybF involved in hydrogenase expression
MPPYEDDEFEEDEFEEDEDSDFVADDESIILACEDCDYRWRSGGDENEEDYSYGTGEMICPMCGSSNVVEI